jgi:hypothetical protein
MTTTESPRAVRQRLRELVANDGTPEELRARLAAAWAALPIDRGMAGGTNEPTGPGE